MLHQIVYLLRMAIAHLPEGLQITSRAFIVCQASKCTVDLIVIINAMGVYNSAHNVYGTQLIFCRF